jgi:anti-sigma factor RsiW
MTARVLRFDDSVHRKVDAILPWFVNGTLADDERATVERHLRECGACRREVEMLQGVHARCRVEEPVPDAGPSLRRLRARVQRPRSLDRVHALWARLGGNWYAAPAWTRWAIAAELAVIACLATLVTMPQRDADAPYRTLGTPGGEVQGSIAVRFANGTSAQAIAAVVAAAGARIVTGPTRDNVYVLDLRGNERDAALTVLRNSPGVMLAQPLMAGPP